MVLDAHAKASVSALGVPLSSDSGVLANCLFTGGSDGSVKLWRLSEKQPEEVQCLDLKGKLPLDLALADLPGSHGDWAHLRTKSRVDHPQLPCW